MRVAIFSAISVNSKNEERGGFIYCCSLFCSVSIAIYSVNCFCYFCIRHERAGGSVKLMVGILDDLKKIFFKL